MIAMKCTLHLGKKYSREHNVREYDPHRWNMDGHIDPERAHLNSIIVDTNYNDFIDDTFGDAIVKFNTKNRSKHPDRLIGFSSAADYDNCPEAERRSRAVAAYAKEHRKDVQEAIIQLGDHDEYLQMVEQFGRDKADTLYAAYLNEAFEKWKSDNQSLCVFCAAIHMDEVQDGSPHLHIDFLPVAKSNRGLAVRASMDGAMKQLGFERKTKAKDGECDKYTETPYKRWLKDRRESYEDFAQAYSNKHKLDIVILPSEPCSAKHEQPQAFKARQGRVKASKGIIGNITGKSHKLRVEAAEYIIDNAQATSDAITAETAEEHTKAAEARAAIEKALKEAEDSRDTAAVYENERAEALKEAAATAYEDRLDEAEDEIQRQIQDGIKQGIEKYMQQYRDSFEKLDKRLESKQQALQRLEAAIDDKSADLSINPLYRLAESHSVQAAERIKAMRDKTQGGQTNERSRNNFPKR